MPSFRLHRTRPAMGTLFEALLVGDDEQHLAAVGEAALNEVTRIERLLSRFDQRSEVCRVNRQAAHGPVLIDREVTALLHRCWSVWRVMPEFDIAAASLGLLCPMQQVAFDFDRRLIEFRHPGVQLDLGAMGKGYALDRAAAILRGFGVENALLHGGTSSVVALGRPSAEGRWQIALRNPWNAREEPLAIVPLENQSLSCSAARHAERDTSDILDPQTGQPLDGDAACLVISADGFTSEVLSTALLVMGRERAQERSRQLEGCAGIGNRGHVDRAAWIERSDRQPRLAWLRQEELA